jgi:hypothetical protein
MSVTLYVMVDGRPSEQDVHLSNGNFRRLMTLIGVDVDEDLCGAWPLDELPALREKVHFALTSLLWMPALDSGVLTTSAQQTGALMLRLGLGEGYFRNRLARLLALIDRALATGQPLRYA